MQKSCQTPPCHACGSAHCNYRTTDECNNARRARMQSPDQKREARFRAIHALMTPQQKRKLADLFADSSDHPSIYNWHDTCTATHPYHDQITWSATCRDWMFG